MEYFLHNFHFLRPWFLLLLLIPIFLYFNYFRGSRIQSSWQKVIDKRLLDFLLIKGSAQKRHFYILIGFLSTILAIIAIAGPTFQKIEVPSYNVQNPVMIVLNMSSDMQEGDLPPSRLSRAKYKINDFLNLLRGVQAGIEIYSNEPFVISPLTDDMNILKNLLPAISFEIMPSNGDRLDRAIDLAVSKIKSAGYNQGRLVIFTPDVGQKFDLALASSKKAYSENFVVDIIGVTSQTNEKLSLVATSGGGQYWNIQTDDSRISELALSLNKQNGTLEESENMRTIWLDAGWYILFLPILGFLMFFRKGILITIFTLLSFNAQAGLFINSNQEGLNSFNNQDYNQAVSLFNDPNWQAASFYRLGDYQKAYKLYQKDNSINGIYNQGNSLAKSGKIAEAIKKYEDVLQQDPNHEDAKFNLDYLKKQQQQKQQQQQNQDKNKNQDNQQQQNQKQDQEQDNQQAESNNQEQNQNSEGSQDSQNQQQSDASQQGNGQQDKNSENQDENANKERQNQMDELNENKQSSEGKDQSGAISQQGNTEDEYNEQMQAKAQQYREIPEDPGGLLKAFIYQEYRQNRYNEQ